MVVPSPTLTLERRLLKEYSLIISCDEVGRGALAGPVAVGAVAIDAARSRQRVVEGLRDSKLIPERRRAAVAERAAQWVMASAVGWADAAEIDRVGIMTALGRAALRAIADLPGVDARAGALVILDGNYDYITPAGGRDMTVRSVIKGDRDCASVSAASVVAKVARDDLMGKLHDEAPVYGWDRNKGYASATHRDAIRSHGLSAYHRASWAITDAPTLF